MVDDYATRLLKAMKDAGETVVSLSKMLGVTRQAITKATNYGSKSLSAANNSRAAKFLRCDPDWLATGEGEQHSERVWPFRRLTPAQWAGLPREVQDFAEGGLLAAAGAPKLELRVDNDHQAPSLPGLPDDRSPPSKPRKRHA